MKILWPEFIFFLAGALKSGVGLNEAIDTAVEESTPALKKEWLRRLGRDFKGLPVEKKVDLIFSDPSLTQTKAVLLMAHETGAAQAKRLEVCGKLLREKIEFKERVRTLTLQSRFTAWIVGLSPLGFLFGMKILAPDLAAPLFETRAGLRLLGCSFVSVIIGLWLVHKLAQVEP